MFEKKCIDCSEYKNCRDTFSSWIFFIVGLIATVAMRVVTVLIHLNPIYGKLAWYIGVSGFFVFFVYKFRVSQTRSKSIENNNLAHKINSRQGLSDDDYSLIGSILCSLSSRKEKINYLFIFVLSGVALGLALYIDFFK